MINYAKLSENMPSAVASMCAELRASRIEREAELRSKRDREWEASKSFQDTPDSIYMERLTNDGCEDMYERQKSLR